MLKQTFKQPVYDILKALSDGSVNDTDSSKYDQIPVSANRISDPYVRD